ncbi:MAG: adenylate/guanylate cyclase domain-containing protein [Chthoniobacter sp.]
MLREAFETQGGYVFKTVGDAFCVAFDTALQALSGALQAQRACTVTAWEGIEELKVRMAIHTGAAEHRDGDYFGQSLNRVARILASAHGGQVLFSPAGRGTRARPPAARRAMRALGEHRLRDLSRPEHLFQLVTSDLPSQFPAPAFAGKRAEQSARATHELHRPRARTRRSEAPARQHPPAHAHRQRRHGQGRGSRCKWPRSCSSNFTTACGLWSLPPSKTVRW